MAKGDVCTIEGCDKIITKDRGGIVCVTHYNRMYKYGSYEPHVPKKRKTPPKKTRVCQEPTCDKILSNKEGRLCQTHVYRLGRYNTPYLPPEKTKRDSEYLMVCKVHGQLTKDQIKFRNRKGSTIDFIGQVCLQCKKLHEVKNKFKISIESYEKMILEQNNLCAICKHPETRIIKGKTASLCVDHCHDAEKIGVMKVRGLLCFSCNIGIGMFKDKAEVLFSAIQFLIKSDTMSYSDEFIGLLNAFKIEGIKKCIE